MCLTPVQQWPHPYLRAGTPTWSPTLGTRRSLFCQSRRAQWQSELGPTKMSCRDGKEEREHPFKTTSTKRSAVPHNPPGCSATWQWGGGDKTCVTDKQPYHLGTPWHRDIPAQVCPLCPLSMNQLGGFKWNLNAKLRGAHGGKEARNGGNLQYQIISPSCLRSWGFPYVEGGALSLI